MLGDNFTYLPVIVDRIKVSRLLWELFANIFTNENVLENYKISYNLLGHNMTQLI